MLRTSPAIDAPGGVSAGVAAPESLRTWIDDHVPGSGGAALAGLVTLLRERGYLSHGLTEAAGAGAVDAVAAGLPFQPSASGHSLARIDAMFTRLLERETDPRGGHPETTSRRSATMSSSPSPWR